MKKYSVFISEPAEFDLQSILLYIAKQLLSPNSAISTIESIEKAFDSLILTPRLCPVVNDERLAALGYRKLIIKNYIAFFTIDESERVVNIERVLYARRDWMQIL